MSTIYDYLNEQEIREGDFDGQEGGYAKPVDSFKNLLFAKELVFFLLIIIFEGIVCVRGANFYEGIGFSFTTAIVCSTLCEAFYMLFSGKSGLVAFLAKGTLLALSITTLTHTTYKSDPNLTLRERTINEKMQESKHLISSLKKELFHEIPNLKVNIEKDAERFRKYDKISRGNSILAPRREKVAEREKEIREDLRIANNDLLTFEKELLDQNIFKNLKELSIATIVGISVFVLLQILICIALPDILGGLISRVKEEH